MKAKTILGAFLLAPALALSVGCAGQQAQSTSAATQAPASEAQVVVHDVVVAAERTEHPLVSHSWLQFRDARDGYVQTLAAPLLECATTKLAKRSSECLRRSATFEIAYALTALSAITQDGRYADAADEAYDPEVLSDIEGMDPYAAAWLLAFAEQRETVAGKKDLRDSADAAAQRLETWLVELDDHSFTQGALFGGENNIAFALHHLWSWSQHTGNEALASRLETFTKTRILGADMDSWCPMPVDGSPESFEFLPPCLQRATTVLSVMPGQISNKWISEFVAAQDQLSPVTYSSLDTHGSLNFSRAWSLWAVYKATGEDRYRDMYVRHVKAQMQRLEGAAARGQAVDPWQASFGVHALSVSY